MMGGYSKHVGLIDLNARGRIRRGIMIAVGQEVGERNTVCFRRTRYTIAGFRTVM